MTSMRLDRLTGKVQDAPQAAACDAQGRAQQAIESDDLLLEVVWQEGGISRPLLEAASASIPGLEAALDSRVERLPTVSGGARPYLSSDVVRVPDKAEKEAEQLKDDHVSTEHILLAAAEHPVLAEVDEIIIFRQNSREQLAAVVDIQLEGLQQRLAERNIYLRVTELAKELLTERGWDPVYGARPLKGTVQRLLQDKLALLILEGRFQEGDQVVVDAENGELLFNKAAPVEETAARAGASGAR